MACSVVVSAGEDLEGSVFVLPLVEVAYSVILSAGVEMAGSVVVSSVV